MYTVGRLALLPAVGRYDGRSLLSTVVSWRVAGSVAEVGQRHNSGRPPPSRRTEASVHPSVRQTILRGFDDDAS